MGKMSSVAEKAHEINDKKKCSVGRFLRVLTEEEAAEFNEVLYDLELSAPSIRVAVQEEYGVALSPTQITRHRGGGCSCL